MIRILLSFLLLVAVGCDTAEQRKAKEAQEALEDFSAGLESMKAASAREIEPGVPALIAGMVVSVHDGDSITVLQDKVQHKIRLAEIDAPELGQPFGKAAKKHLSDLVFGKQVEINVIGKDRDKRLIGRVVVRRQISYGNHPEHKINQQMILDGFAWHYTDYSDARELAIAEKKARESSLGLWAENDPVPPWEWWKQRKAKRKAKNKIQILDFSGHGMTVPILTSREQLDDYVSRVVAIRGLIGNTKVPTIIGVEVSGGQNLPDAVAVGMLGKFVTTQKEADDYKNSGHSGQVQGSFGPGTRYILYSSLHGRVSSPQPWGTGYTREFSEKQKRKATASIK